MTLRRFTWKIDDKYMTNSFKSKVLRSFIWKFSEQVIVGSIQIIIGIILARLLLPSDYAILIIATVFIAISRIFVDSGLSSALVQKKEITQTDTSSIFFLSLFIAALLYGTLFITAPIIADFYHESELTQVLRALGLTLFAGALSSIQNVFVSREFKFKTLFIVSLIAGLISGLIGIAIAYIGYGVWALVWQQLISSGLTAILLTILVRWKPILTFSITSVKTLFSFGSKILAASLIGQAYESIRDLSVGALYSKDALAYYNKGYEYPTYLCTCIDGSVAAVLFPAYTKYQDNKETLKFMLRRSVAASSFIVWPAMLGLAAIAPSFVSVFLTDKWSFCVPFIQIFCIYQALQPISSANLSAIKAIGRSDTLLRLEIIKRVFGFVCLLCTLPLGVMEIAIGAVIFKIFSVLINVYPNKRLFNYRVIELFKDIAPFMFLSVFMASIVSCVQFFRFAPIITLCIQIIFGIFIYVCGAWMFKMETLKFIIDVGKEYIRGNIRTKE